MNNKFRILKAFKYRCIKLRAAVIFTYVPIEDEFVPIKDFSHNLGKSTNRSNNLHSIDSLTTLLISANAGIAIFRDNFLYNT
jgi:hypothetical protein